MLLDLVRKQEFRNSLPKPKSLPVGILVYLTGGSLILAGFIGCLLFGLPLWAVRSVGEANIHGAAALSILTGILLAPFALAGALVVAAAVIVDLTLAAIFTLISLPVIGYLHAKSAQKGSELKLALESELKITATDTKTFIDTANAEAEDVEIKIGLGQIPHDTPLPPIYTAMDKDLFDNSSDHWEIVNILFIKENGMTFKSVHIDISTDPHDTLHTILLFRDNAEGRTAFDAFTQLNITNYKKFIATHPLTDNPYNTTRVIKKAIEAVTQSYDMEVPHTDGKTHATDRPFNWLPINIIEKIVEHVADDLGALNHEEKLALINETTIKIKGKTTAQENAEKLMAAAELDDLIIIDKQPTFAFKK